MHCLIETVRRGEISEARDIDTERLSLGRGADQDIRLQSRLAGLSHAVIEQGNDGKLRIRAIAPNRILHNGRKLAESVLTPGDEFSIGNVCFTVREAPETYNLRLEIKEPAGRQSKELEDALLASCRSGFRAERFFHAPRHLGLVPGDIDPVFSDAAGWLCLQAFRCLVAHRAGAIRP